MATEKQQGDPEPAGPRRTPLLHRLPTVLAVLVLVLAFASPYVWVVLAAVRCPLAGIIGAPLVAVLYSRMRFGGGIFGPLWLELVDMVVILGNAGSFVFSCVVAVRNWL